MLVPSTLHLLSLAAHVPLILGTGRVSRRVLVRLRYQVRGCSLIDNVRFGRAIGAICKAAVLVIDLRVLVHGLLALVHGDDQSA